MYIILSLISETNISLQNKKKQSSVTLQYDELNVLLVIAVG